MKRLYFLVTLLAAIIGTNSAFAAAIGKVVAISGSPISSGPSGNRALKAGSEVFENDKITVGSGNAQILLSDGTKLVVGPGSALLLDKYLFRGGNTAQKVSIKALRGTFRFISGRSAKSAYDIRTANATIGIRGTGFDFSVARNTVVAVLNGKVRLCGRGGACVNMNAGCEVAETAPPKTQKLSGKQKAARIKNRLPFLNSQSGLSNAFRLNTNACRQQIGFDEFEQGRNSSAFQDNIDTPGNQNCVPSVGNAISSGC